MKLYLNVPFEEKDAAKKLGARWNPQLKLWFVEIQAAVEKTLYPWLIQDSSYNLLADHYSLVLANKSCWKCGEMIVVSTFLLDRYYELSEQECSESGIRYLNWEEVENQTFVSNITMLYKFCLLEMNQQNPDYRKTFSKTLNESYFANNCPYCLVLQGDFNLYQEPSGIFYDCRNIDKFKSILNVDETFKAQGNTALTAGSAEGLMIKVISSS